MRFTVLLGIALTIGFAVRLSAENKKPQKDVQDELTLLEGAWTVVSFGGRRQEGPDGVTPGDELVVPGCGVADPRPWG